MSPPVPQDMRSKPAGEEWQAKGPGGRPERDQRQGVIGHSDRKSVHATTEGAQGPVISSCVRRDILNLLNMSEATSKAQSTFIEDMGQMMAGWGIARTSGRIYAYLLLKKEP